MIITPKVREEARKYFKCPSLEGAELENQFESEDIGSHWEKRVFEVIIFPALLFNLLFRYPILLFLL